jgi:predicted regulator of Ras-like GTPase activity (Roadblock/LC7/MglB family)
MVQVQWYGGEDSILSLQSQLRRLLTRSGALSALLMDSAGRLLTMVGNVIPQFDVTSFVSLSASDFAATQELAKLLGEETFHDLYHQGDTHGIYVTHIHDGLLLAVLFDRKTTLGLVRHAIRKARPKIRPLLSDTITEREKDIASVAGASELGRLEGEVDQLFDESASA